MTTTLHTALARLERHVAERRARRPAPSVASRRGATPRPLPGEDQPRLFSERLYRTRPFHTGMPVRLPGAADRTLAYTGPQLALDDRAVWRWLLKLYRPRGKQDRPIEFSAAGLLRSLGWDTSRQGLDRLRLQATTPGLPDAGGRETHYRSLINDARCWQTPGGRCAGKYGSRPRFESCSAMTERAPHVRRPAHHRQPARNRPELACAGQYTATRASRRDPGAR